MLRCLRPERIYISSPNTAKTGVTEPLKNVDEALYLEALQEQVRAARNSSGTNQAMRLVGRKKAMHGFWMRMISIDLETACQSAGDGCQLSLVNDNN